MPLRAENSSERSIDRSLHRMLKHMRNVVYSISCDLDRFHNVSVNELNEHVDTVRTNEESDDKPDHTNIHARISIEKQMAHVEYKVKVRRIKQNASNAANPGQATVWSNQVLDISVESFYPLICVKNMRIQTFLLFGQFSSCFHLFLANCFQLGSLNIKCCFHIHDSFSKFLSTRLSYVHL